jgi:hypothetical protein
VAWLQPAAALGAQARGELPMWLPTFVTLQQLEGLRDGAELSGAFGDGGAAGAPEIVVLDEGLRQVAQPWAAGIEGRTTTGWIVGRREWVIVDPADPTGETAEAIARAAVAAGARLAGVAVRDLRPERHAGVEMFAAGLGLPVVGGPGAAVAPYPITELADGEHVPVGDVALVARNPATTDGSGRWPGAVSFEGPGGRLVS